MSLSEPALPLRADDTESLTFTFDDRHWRVRGLDKQLSCERMRVNLMVCRRELSHLDTLDLYASRLRKMFVREAAAELYVEEATVKQDLGRVLRELEARQEAMIRQRVAREQPEAPEMTEPERREALELLADPKLLERILADYDACGLVGEETGKLVCYLACVSRRLAQPLAVLVRSGSAAGKSSLVEATLGFMPPEEQIRLSALTAQSLFASLALLHQHQRKQTMRTVGGQSRCCVIATLEDLEAANRLACEALVTQTDALLPQSRQLLSELEHYVLRRAKAEAVPREDVRFTQREARESLGWSDRSLRRHLARLVELEYLVVYRTGRGNQRAYQLLYDSRAADGHAHLLGLADVDQFRRSPRKKASAAPSHGRNGQRKGRTGTPAPPEPAPCQT